MTIFRFDLETKNFYEITTRNGGSNKLKWTTLIRQVYLKDVQFGVCQHPFDPENFVSPKTFLTIHQQRLRHSYQRH